MKFYILSDLHLEMSNYNLEKIKDVDNLILAGDIGIPTSPEYESFIKKTSELYKNVFLITGNHEYYENDIRSTNDIIELLIKEYDNVYFLNNKTIDIDDYRIIGTILWSDIMEYERSEIQQYISDFRLIKNWSIEKNNHEHFKNIQFIKNEIKRGLSDNKKLIIITHHAPLRNITCKPEHIGSLLSSAFSTDLSYLFKKPIVAWIFGHTHYSCNTTFNDIKLISNQRGYNDEKTKFDPLFVVDM